MRQPQSGRICRSPSAVPMMTRTDSSMFCSYFESWTAPFGPTEKGNLKPTPRKLLMAFRSLPAGSGGGDPHLDDALAIGAAHGGSPFVRLHHQPFGVLALGTDEPLRPPSVDGLDHVVPKRFELAEAVLRAVWHRAYPQYLSVEIRRLSNVTLSGGRELRPPA